MSANPSGKGEGLSLLCLGTGQANAEMCEDHAPTLNADHEQPIVCMADDNANAAIDIGVAGSLKVGGGVADDCVGALCARDFKGVGTQYVSEGKLICERRF